VVVQILPAGIKRMFMEAFMKKSKLFFMGILGILLVFGFVLMGCGGDDNGGGIKNPPDPPNTVASAGEAEEYFYEVWGTLTDDQKEMFINYINESLPEGISPIEKLDDLPDTYWESVKDNWDNIKEPFQDFVDEVKEQNDTTPERWSVWAADDTQATIQHSVDSDGVCTITIGGTAEADIENIWKVNCGYPYTGEAGASYTYVFEAWTASGERTINVQYFGGGSGDVAGPPYLVQNIDITAIRKEYTIVGNNLPKGGVIPIEFQCANQLGTFYIKIVSIDLGSGSVPESNAPVYYQDGKEYTGNGTVKLVCWDGEKEVEGPIVGTVTGGKLTLNLPSSVSNEYLTEASGMFENIPEITVTPGDVLIDMGMSFYLFEGDEKLASIEKKSGDASHSVMYRYFSKAATIKGTFITVGNYPRTYNFDARTGWNAIYRHDAENEDIWTTDLSKVPSGLKWTINQ
jgi:hypothetical protein